uniref:Uncharacterized protein n=1 Tax=Anopheles melas TaxID=34690 RepID=A0A182THV6_9DIPT
MANGTVASPIAKEIIKSSTPANGIHPCAAPGSGDSTSVVVSSSVKYTAHIANPMTDPAVEASSNGRRPARSTRKVGNITDPSCTRASTIDSSAAVSGNANREKIVCEYPRIALMPVSCIPNESSSMITRLFLFVDYGVSGIQKNSTTNPTGRESEIHANARNPTYGPTEYSNRKASLAITVTSTPVDPRTALEDISPR